MDFKENLFALRMQVFDLGTSVAQGKLKSAESVALIEEEVSRCLHAFSKEQNSDSLVFLVEEWKKVQESFGLYQTEKDPEERILLRGKIGSFCQKMLQKIDALLGESLKDTTHCQAAHRSVLSQFLEEEDKRELALQYVKLLGNRQFAETLVQEVVIPFLSERYDSEKGSPSEVKHALEMTALIQEERRRFEMMREIAQKAAKKGDLDEAIEAIDHIPHNRLERTTGMRFVALRIAQQGQYERAIHFAQFIPQNPPHDQQKAFALRDLAKYLAEQGEFEKAKRATFTIPESHSNQRSIALKDIVQQILKGKHLSRFEEAIKVTEYIPHHSSEKTIVLSLIARQLAENREFEQAEEVAKLIPDRHERQALLDNLPEV